ncbi:MAG TPA: glycosyl hydrolase [Gaiellaceae bacterium]|nr:glycosyl hydrolase [Gaiellaceae bacterium]
MIRHNPPVVLRGLKSVQLRTVGATVAVVALLPPVAVGATQSGRTGGADLVVRKLSASASAKAEGVLLVSDSIGNVGKDRAAASRVAYFLAKGRTRARRALRLVIGSRRVPALVSTQTSARRTRIELPRRLAAGRYFVAACADVGGHVDERVERNNCRLARRPVTVAARARRVGPAVPTLIDRPADPTNSTEATFSFAGEPNVAFRCSVDGDDFGPCRSPTTYSAFSEGRHAFSVKALAAGRESPPATYEWHVDLSPPAPPVFVAMPPDPTASRTASIAFTGEVQEMFKCSLDGGAFTPCSSPQRVGGPLADGSHRFAVKAQDRAGNESAAAFATWTVDTAPPAPPLLLSVPDDPTNDTHATFRVAGAPESGGTWLCRLDAAAQTPCGSVQHYPGPLPEGSHRFEVEAMDAAGNIARTAHTWVVDTTPPPPPALLTAPENPTSDRTATFTFTDAESRVTFRCWRDGGSIEWCPSPHTYSNLGDGDHRFAVIARDEAGNWSVGSVHRWLIDTTPPPALGLDLGVFAGTKNPEGVAAFATWLRRPITRVLEYLGYASWSDIENPPEIDVWKGRGYRMVYAVPMLPASGASLRTGAAGTYNDRFRALARRLVDAGQANAVIRLGWEFNGWWYPWTAKDDPVAFAEYWRQIVTAMRSVPGGSFKFDWSTNVGPASVEPDKAYPGDAYVDYVGITVFDQDWYPGWQDPRLRWQNLVNLPFGLLWHRDFALQHGKPVVFDEWGLSIRDDGHGGGDDPYYVSKMFTWLNATRAAWALYFEFDKEDGRHALTNGQFPLAAKRFRELFGS